MRYTLGKLGRAKLFRRLHKHELLEDTADYLGFDVINEGVRISPDKVKVILIDPGRSVHIIFLHFGGFLRIITNLLAVSRR